MLEIIVANLVIFAGQKGDHTRPNDRQIIHSAKTSTISGWNLPHSAAGSGRCASSVQ